jgi:hypothetical protein
VGRPLVLHPPVAAALVVGVRRVLAGPAGARLDGRRELPPLTLVDRPVHHLEGTLDDAGLPAGSWTLIRRGRVATMPVDERTGLPVGRAVWSHDESRLTAAPDLALQVTGPEAEPGPEVVHVLGCLEGTDRHHLDGRLQLICLARDGAAGPTFRIGLTGPALSLLRLVTALAGPAGTDSSDQTVVTPSLLLPPAASLERSPDVRIAAL